MIFFRIFNQLQKQNFPWFFGPSGKNRNDKVWNKVDIDPSISVNLSYQYLTDWRAPRRNMAEMQPSPMEHHARSWKPLPNGFLKCNLDAAIFNELNSFRVGVCVRGEQDNFIKAKTTLFKRYPNINRSLKLDLTLCYSMDHAVRFQWCYVWKWL